MQHYLLLFSYQVASNFLWPHELQHSRPPCPSSSGICPTWCPLNWWCHPTILSSVTSSPSAFSLSNLPMNIQGWFSLGLTDLISLLSKGLSRAFSNTTVKSISSLVLTFLYGPTLTSVFDISISSVQFSRSVMSDSLWPHELQHARPPCPSPAPRVYPNPCPSSWWCYPAISSSVIPFSSCPQSFPTSGSFPMSQLFAWRWPKYWSFSFSISLSNEHPGLISFRMVHNFIFTI